MIVAGALLCVLQAVAVVGAAPSTPHALTIRVLGEEVRHLPLVAHTDGQLGVRADQLARALGGSVERLRNGHFSLTVPGLTLELADQSGFATSPTTVIPLPAPAWVDGAVLYLPLADVADVLPRIASGLLYDPANTEVRVFAALPSHGRHPSGTVHDLTGEPLPAATESPPGAVATLAPPAGAMAMTPRADDADTVGVSPEGDVLLGDRDDRPAAPPPAPAPAAARRRLIVVDAGHGGPDHGMSGPIGSSHPLYEKNITLAVALKVGAALKRMGMDVLQTRTTDTLIALSDRGRIANAHHGDLFLSIHVNAANPNWHDPAAARGFETYFLAEAKTEDDRRVEQMENEAVRFETGATAAADDPLNFVINDMYQNQHLRESSELAAIIQHHLGEIHPGPDRGVKQAGFVVLVTAYMPAVLVEIGFGTNAAEARYLDQPAAQTKIAGAIAAATADYLARYQRRVSAVAQ